MEKDIKNQFEQLGKTLKTLATKEDLKSLATKDELKGLATKDELKNLATKEELKGLATKEDLKTQTKELKAFAVEQIEELSRIVNGGFDDVLNRLDVRERMLIMEKKMKAIESALQIKIEA